MKGSVKAHISLLLAASMWGLMSPVCFFFQGNM